MQRQTQNKIRYWMRKEKNVGRFVHGLTRFTCKGHIVHLAHSIQGTNKHAAQFKCDERIKGKTPNGAKEKTTTSNNDERNKIVKK